MNKRDRRREACENKKSKQIVLVIDWNCSFLFSRSSYTRRESHVLRWKRRQCAQYDGISQNDRGQENNERAKRSSPSGRPHLGLNVTAVSSGRTQPATPTGCGRRRPYGDDRRGTPVAAASVQTARRRSLRSPASPPRGLRRAGTSRHCVDPHSPPRRDRVSGRVDRVGLGFVASVLVSGAVHAVGCRHRRRAGPIISAGNQHGLPLQFACN
jgi:hypothetical protein